MSCLPLNQYPGDTPEPVADDERPRTRGECPKSRPCPWVGCRYHLYLDINPKTGAIRLLYPDKEPWELAETCALDVAERAGRRGGLTLKEVGNTLNLTRERIRQIQVEAVGKLGAYRRWLK